MAKARRKSGSGGAPTAQPPGETSRPQQPLAPPATATPTARPQTSPSRAQNRTTASGQSPAEAALARGDARAARRLAAQEAASGNEAARRVLDETRPDPVALIAAAAVLLAILLAAWLALFRAH